MKKRIKKAYRKAVENFRNYEDTDEQTYGYLQGYKDALELCLKILEEKDKKDEKEQKEQYPPCYVFDCLGTFCDECSHSDVCPDFSCDDCEYQRECKRS